MIRRRRRRRAHGSTILVTDRRSPRRPRRQNVLLALAPGKYVPLVLGLFAEDEPDEDIEAPDREEEKGGHERECVDIVRKDGCADARDIGAQSHPKKKKKMIVRHCRYGGRV